MKFKREEIEVIDKNNILVNVNDIKIKFNLRNGKVRKDLKTMGLISSDEEFETYLIRAANEYVLKGLHKKKTKKWIYEKGDEPEFKDLFKDFN